VAELDDLAGRSVAGDGAALAALCQALEAPIYRLCLRMLGDVGDAEDAAQDVLVKVITNLSSFEGRSALSTWVHQVAVRHVLGLKRSRAEARGVDEAGFEALLEQGLAFGAALPPPSPEDRTLLGEVRLACTQGMLLMLSREERLALVLVDLLGFEGPEAAAVAEVSADAFRQRLSRARARLAGFLRARCGVVDGGAACRCERQLPAKQALGLRRGGEVLTPLSEGDLRPAADDVLAAAGELRALRDVAAAFHEGGRWTAPGSLRARMRQVLPTVLGTPPE
jgi:RNA polymerase sigma factor (sigma-70 family)